MERVRRGDPIRLAKQSVRSHMTGAWTELRTLWRPLGGLLLALFLNRTCSRLFPALQIAVPVGIAILLSRTRFADGERSLVRLWQLIGSGSALYAFFHYPLVPLAQPDAIHVALYALLLTSWILCLTAGLLCYRIPSLSVLPPGYLVWSNTVANLVADFPTTTHLDIQPLAEVSMCIAFGLLLTSRPRPTAPEGRASFAQLVFLLAVATHLANYAWSFAAKMSLRGPFGAWLTDNNPAYIFLAALDNNHILFSGFPQTVGWLYALLDHHHLVGNLLLLIVQASAVFILLMPHRALVVLLLMLDVMHLSIILVAGANFWPWIMLNVIITIVVVRRGAPPASCGLRLIASGFILISPAFVSVARLGWFDTGAHNRIFVEAVDRDGAHYTVPSNFFTFYSYSFAHMDYGSPDPDTAFATQEPNGGAADYALFQAGRRCDVRALVRPQANRTMDPVRLSAFFRHYHQLVLDLTAQTGTFPYDIYPHHFFVPSSSSKAFARLDKRLIVSYLYRRESVCLGFDAHGLQRRVVSSASFAIELGKEKPFGGT